MSTRGSAPSGAQSAYRTDEDPSRSTNESRLTRSDSRAILVGMRPVRERGASYGDIVALPESRVGEIVDGELYASPRPAPRHALAASGLGGLLFGPFQLGTGGPGGWWILDEPELHLGGDVLVPDLAGWRRERMPALPEGPWFETAPDWVCEILSPSTAHLDRSKKLRAYAREKVAHAWLIDPLCRTLEVLRLIGDQWTLLLNAGATDRVRAEPFEALDLDLAALWG